MQNFRKFRSSVVMVYIFFVKNPIFHDQKFEKKIGVPLWKKFFLA